MKQGVLAALLVVALGVPPGAWADSPSGASAGPDAGLSDAERYLSHPFMTRAWQAAEREDWKTVESITRHLLGRIPAHQDARALLAQSLARRGAFDAALTELAALRDHQRAQRSTHELQLRWIAEGTPPAATVTRWVADAPPSQRDTLWRAYSLRLQEREGPRAALDWLATIRPTNVGALARWRAVLAEMSGAPGTVVEALQPLLDTDGRLSPEDWRRLALAQLALGDDAALARLLDRAPDPAQAEALRRLAIERAAAANRPAAALGWVEPDQAADSMPTDDRMLLELARQAGDVARVLTLSDRLDRPCLETVEWLVAHDRRQALTRLARCAPAREPQRWLVLAERLGAVELMATRPMPGRWEALRQERVVALWRAAGEADRALRWLATLPKTPANARLNAELLQAQEDPRAAEAWIELHRLSGAPDALNQASFLLVRQGRNDAAFALLEQAFLSAPAGLDAAALGRLASLLLNRPQRLSDPRFIDALLPRLARVDRAELLARLAALGRCADIERWSPADGRLATESIALARCAGAARPGVAAFHYRAAIAAGATGQQRALAYALQEAGEADAALALWTSEPPDTLTDDERLAAARTALAAGEPRTADTFWRRLEPTTRERSPDALRLGAAIALALEQPGLALERDRRALALAPTPEQHYAAAGSALAAGEADTSREWLARAVALAPTEPGYRLDLGLRLAAHQAREIRLQAIPYLEQARRDYPSDMRVPEALSLRYMESGRDQLASPLMREAIDLQHDALMTATEAPDWLQRRRYAMRRAHEAQTRRDSFSLSSTWSPYGAGSGAGQPVRGDNFQMFSWDRPLEDDDGNARRVSVYARVLGQGPKRHDYADALGVGIGLRARPWQDRNVNLYAELYHERQIDGGADRGTDLLLRASASFLDQGEYRNDWRPDRSHWSERVLYLDAGWFVRSNERLMMARYQQGRTFRLPLEGAHTLMPYGVVQGVAINQRQDLRAGLGLRWQSWFDEDRYSAYRGRFAVRLEYQRNLGGTLYDRANGWQLGMEVNW